VCRESSFPGTPFFCLLKGKKPLDAIYYPGSITAVVMIQAKPKSKPKIHRLGDLQLRILQILWLAHEASVAQVHESLARDLDLAYTTVATMLRKMEARALVTHRLEGRAFIYRPLVAEETVARSMANEVLGEVCGGSLSGLVNQLLTTREIRRREMDSLEKMVARKRKRK
jgi:predicted transcriptional regulator